MLYRALVAEAARDDACMEKEDLGFWTREKKDVVCACTNRVAKGEWLMRMQGNWGVQQVQQAADAQPLEGACLGLSEIRVGVFPRTWGVQEVQQAADAQPLERARDARARGALAHPAAQQAVDERALAHVGEADHHRAHRARLEPAPRARLVDARGLAQRRLGDLRCAANPNPWSLRRTRASLMRAAVSRRAALVTCVALLIPHAWSLVLKTPARSMWRALAYAGDASGVRRHQPPTQAMSKACVRSRLSPRS